MNKLNETTLFEYTVIKNYKECEIYKKITFLIILKYFIDIYLKIIILIDLKMTE